MGIDRFDEVKHRFEEGWPNAGRWLADVAWMIGELERLYRERAQFIVDAATAVEQIRAVTEGEKP